MLTGWLELPLWIKDNICSHHDLVLEMFLVAMPMPADKRRYHDYNFPRRGVPVSPAPFGCHITNLFPSLLSLFTLSRWKKHRLWSVSSWHAPWFCLFPRLPLPGCVVIMTWGEAPRGGKSHDGAIGLTWCTSKSLEQETKRRAEHLTAMELPCVNCRAGGLSASALLPRAAPKGLPLLFGGILVTKCPRIIQSLLQTWAKQKNKNPHK